MPVQFEEIADSEGNKLVFDATTTREEDEPESAAPFVHYSREILDRYKGPPLETVVDIGAHVGTFSILAAKLWKAKFVVACEPDPENRAKFTNNVRINGVVDQVLVLPFAVTGGRSLDQVTLQRLSGATGNSGQSSMALDFGPSAHKFSAFSISIIDLFQLVLGRCPRIDLLKIDIEGAEWTFLESREFERYLGNVGFVDFELHRIKDGFPERIEQVRSRMEQLGFRGSLADVSEGAARYYGAKLFGR